MDKIHQRGDNLKNNKAKALIFIPDTSSLPVPHNNEVSSKYSKQHSSYSADKKMHTVGRTDGRMPGSSVYPPNLLSGDKKVYVDRA